MNIDTIGPGKKAPEIINVIIEVPKGSNNKYEFDKEAGIVKLDRVLYSAVFYPTDYGFVPNTLCDDGDPLDAFVLSTNAFCPGVWVEARPIGMIQMVDGGEQDDKLLCVPAKDPRFDHVKTIRDVSPHGLKEIQHFLSTYKLLQKKTVVVKEWQGVEDAHALIRKSIKNYSKK
ncbi:MAG: inorganic diphosphatase [archaeon]